jgi:hypothetical protein
MTTKITVDATGIDKDVMVTVLEEADGEQVSENVVSSGDVQEFYIHGKQCLFAQELFVEVEGEDDAE